MVEFDRSAFIGKFQEEAAELLQRLNEGVIMLESTPDDRELIDRMMRDAHTIKGSSRMVGLIEISDVAHWLENIMVRVRDKEMAYTPDMSDSFFEALDAIVYLTDHSGVNTDGVVDLDGLKARLAVIAATGIEDDEAEAEEQTAAADKKALKKRTKKSKDEPDAAATAVAADGEQPVADDASGADRTPSHEELEHDDLSGTPSDADDQPHRLDREAELRTKVQATIRIRTNQLDNLLNLISEVVIAQIKSEQHLTEVRSMQVHAHETSQTWARIKSMLAALGRTELLEALGDDMNEIDRLLGDSRRDLAEFAKDYAEDTSRASVVINDLQEQGMRLRMLPANTIFQTFPRAVRDLAKQFRKDIELIIEGGETELDKKVLEEINDPLVHIMRNAVDHGIEDPETRLALGKPAQGTVRLAARQEGDRIVIEVSDDGAGIDPEKVRQSAVRKGYITAAEAKSVSDREAQYMIFEAGFSTAAIITEISGRGVGMDVVREFVVEKLKGSLDLDSVPGQGTTFKLTIPLTLAIIRALMLRVGDHIFALPTSSVDETLRIDPSEILKVEGREVVRRQRRTIPIVRLSDILGVAAETVQGGKVPIATISYSGQRMGFIVDAFVGEQQIVIKPLGTHLAKVENVAGVTILGAGQVVPILNVPDLMANARSRSGQKGRHAEQRAEREGPRTILICEDSFTTRELERSIFEAAGYEVETAVDGANGLSKLRDGLAPDAVVTDVQMPNMTGFELTRAIKNDANLKDIPVVIVTSLEREEEKAEGIEAGADAYITKSVFNQDTLLDTVERLIR
ncbi:MAG: hybrid sensor histidine kinase/response regulator [Coriobacteriia bacterium]|nr:hybrid sensor histidine kinase/response regulator [Coriobacteriia bacterium]